MRKALFIIHYSLFIILFSGCSLRLPFRQKTLSALSVSSVPTAQVFLNGENQGQTPFYDETLKSGDYTLKISANGQEWSSKIKLSPGVTTVVNRELTGDESSQSGEIITLEKGRGIAIISNPSQAVVRVDGQEKGTTPLVVEDVEPGDHSVILKAPGFLERMVKVRVREDYKLTINMQLAAQSAPSASPQPEAPLSPPPSVEPSGPHIIVKETSTSFGLHVRSGAGLGYPVIEDIKPGEKYPILGEEKGWINIRLSDGKEGWVSGKYVIKKE